MKSFHVPCNTTVPSSTFQESNISEVVSITPSLPSSSFDGTKSLEQAASKRSRRLMLLSNSAVISTVLFPVTAFVTSSAASSLSTSNSSTASSGVITEFSELPNSGGVKALDLRLGSGYTPVDGDQVAIHYYGRLAAKQGWRFDSTYDHKDSTGDSVPFTFILGSNSVISGIEATVRSMRVGGIRRVIIPPSQGYQNTNQEPLPPNFFDRQRLFTTIFNPTRLANGEGSTLGTLIFDVELVNVKH